MIQFIVDSVVRAINVGTPRETALANLEVPVHLKNDPDLQWHYHSLPFVWRGLYSRLGGWYGDEPLELFETTPKADAKNLMALAGGRTNLLSTAKTAYENGDMQWAAKLAHAAVTLDPDDGEAEDILINAMRSVAFDTESTSRRNYLLTEALMMRGELDRSKQKPLLAVGALLSAVDNMKLIEAITPRIDMKASQNVEDSWIVNFEGESDKSIITIRKGVATVRPLAGHPNPPRQKLNVNRPAMIGILVGQTNFKEALDNGDFSSDDVQAAKSFFELFDSW